MMCRRNGVLHTKRQCRHCKYPSFSLTCYFWRFSHWRLVNMSFLVCCIFLRFFFLEPGLSFWLTYPVFCPNFPSPKTFWSRLDYIEQPVIFFPCINSFTFCETCLFAFSPRIPVSQHFLPLCEAVLLFFSCVYCCWLCKAPGEQVVVLRISDHDLMQKVEYSELLYIR